MKKTELRMMIREVVREEVKMELRRILVTKKKKTLSSNQPVAKKPVRRPAAETKISYSTNPILNDVLTETAQSTDWQTMGDEPYTTDNTNSVLQNSHSELMDPPTNINSDQMVTSLGAHPDRVPDHLKDVLTKDYSSFMKKVEDKAKSRRP